jgi:hypothetical protein
MIIHTQSDPADDNREPEDFLIDVWEVEPHLDPSYGIAVFDDHIKAIDYVREVALSMVDEAGENDEFEIKIRHRTMTVYDFEEMGGVSE